MQRIPCFCICKWNNGEKIMVSRIGLQSVQYYMLRGHNWVHFAHMRIRIIWAYSFARKGDGFSLFLRAFPREIDLWVTLGDFTTKTRIVKGNLYLTENWLSRNEMWCTAYNHNCMCHTCAKELLDSNFN